MYHHIFNKSEYMLNLWVSLYKFSENSYLITELSFLVKGMIRDNIDSLSLYVCVCVCVCVYLISVDTLHRYSFLDENGVTVQKTHLPRGRCHSMYIGET